MSSVQLNGSIPPDAYVFLIGGMKCGTTSLFHYLAEHPQICRSAVKEPEYFCSNSKDGSTNVKFYEDLWAFNPSVHRYALEGSTGYTKFPVKKGVPEQMYNAGLKPKFIYVVRNPYDRIESHLNHILKKKLTHKRLDGHLYISFSNYYQQLKQYTAFFPKESILVIDYELLDKNPAECLEKIYTFLNLPAEHIPAEFSRHNQMKHRGLGEKIFGSASAKMVLGRKRKYLIRLLDRFSPPPARPKLTNAERQIIHSSLYDDMQKLQTEFKVDVKPWGFV